GVVTMNRAAEAATHETRPEKREEWNRRYLWARRALASRMSILLGELARSSSVVRWTTRLFFLDVDGVLDGEWLGFPHTTPSGIAALDLLRSHDFSVVLNTGRSIEDVRDYCSIYRLPGGIAEHGSVFVDAVRGAEVSLVHPDAAVPLARSRSLIGGLRGGCRATAYRHSGRPYRYLGRRTLELTREEVETLLRRHRLDRLTVLDRAEDTYIVGEGVDKAAGMRAAKEYLGLPCERVVAIGDAADAAGMLERGDAILAPRNCPPGVRRLGRRGGCRVLRQPLQRGLLAAVRTELRKQSGLRIKPRMIRPTAAGAGSLLVTLLHAAEHSVCRHWPD